MSIFYTARDHWDPKFVGEFDVSRSYHLEDPIPAGWTWIVDDAALPEIGKPHPTMADRFARSKQPILEDRPHGIFRRKRKMIVGVRVFYEHRLKSFEQKAAEAFVRLGIDPIQIEVGDANDRPLHMMPVGFERNPSGFLSRLQEIVAGLIRKHRQEAKAEIAKAVREEFHNEMVHGEGQIDPVDLWNALNDAEGK